MSISDAKKQHESRLLGLAGVVSVGIGRDDEGNDVIVIGLESPRPDTEAALPKTLEGYPVIVRTVGKIKAQ